MTNEQISMAKYYIHSNVAREISIYLCVFYVFYAHCWSSYYE